MGAFYTPIAEGEVGCTVNLLLAKLEGDAERLSSVKLTAGVDIIDYLPFDSGEVVIDTSVVRDDLVHAFEPAGTSIQLQVRARNRSAETRQWRHFYSLSAFPPSASARASGWAEVDQCLAPTDSTSVGVIRKII